MSGSLVEFQNVTKRYLSRKAIDDVSFALPAGKMIGLIGPNGSGKSTTLKLIAGLIRPTNGTVIVNGQPVSRRGGRDIAFLPDSNALYSFYTVDETLVFFSRIYQDFDLQKARGIADSFDLDGSQSVRSLSKGTLGRLKIVLALSRQVPLILMDEPLSGLDPLVRKSIVQSLISFVDLDSQTVIMSTHEATEVEPILDVAVLMVGGKLRGIEELETVQAESQGLLAWMKETVDVK